MKVRTRVKALRRTIQTREEQGKGREERTYCHEVNDEQLRRTIIAKALRQETRHRHERHGRHEAREGKFNALEAEFTQRVTARRNGKPADPDIS